MTSRRVALVVTGKLEYRGLAQAMNRLFPNIDFAIASNQIEDELFDTTSCKVDPNRNAMQFARASEYEGTRGDDQYPFPKIDELVGYLAGSLCGRNAADFALLVEDLELVNRGNEQAVLQAVHDAVGRHLERIKKHKNAPQKLDSILRERASFHLFDPMIEAYFFADDDALKRSGPTFHPPNCSHEGLDPERFRVCCDEPFFDENLGECFKAFDSLRNEPIRYSKKKESNCPWNGPGREFHPKKYLCYLCRRNAPFDFCTSYSETGDPESFGGMATLQNLDWTKVFVHDNGAPYLRALVEDLEDALGIRPTLPNWPQTPTSNARTARCNAVRERVLRNV